MFTARRSSFNPILNPQSGNAWDSLAAFNWSPIEEKGKTTFVYRAMPQSENIAGTDVRFSTVGIGTLSKGKVSNRRIFFKPEFEWEKYGIEDPRITKIGKTYFISYTAIGGNPAGPGNIKAAVALSDDLKKIKARYLATPFNAKAMAFFPRKINGKITAVVTAHSDEPPSKVAVISFDTVEDIRSADYWNVWHEHINDCEINPRRKPDEHIEVGAAPVETPHGWLLVYSHIQHYTSSRPIFGIEAVLLDLNDPTKVIGKTKGPILVSEESYEKFGQVPTIVFPSGVLLKDKTLSIWYGGADTVGCTADVDVDDLIEAMTSDDEMLERFPGNPLLLPLAENAWENKTVFNPAAILLDGKTHLLYRAMGNADTSVIGYAELSPSLKVVERSLLPVYTPRANFEMKKSPGNSGCEDPRITLIGERIYMLYTAYNGERPPAVALTSIRKEDFLAKKWNWTDPKLVTHEGLDDKDAGLFPRKVEGKYLLLHRIEGHICLDELSSLDDPRPLEEATPLFGPRMGMWDSLRIGITAPPIETKIGWLLLYHGIDESGTYRVGASLLDLKNPWKVLSRTADFIFEPRTEYEKNGIVNNVVFPCGITVEGDALCVYYGGADKVVAVAGVSLREILKRLK